VRVPVALARRRSGRHSSSSASARCPSKARSQNSQNAIDALAELPVHGVVTVGDSVDPTALKPAANVVVFATTDHDDSMRRAALVVTHGGHGTFMRALKYGLPVVVIPGMAPTSRSMRRGAGLGSRAPLPGDATADMMRSAVEEVLASPSCRDAARADSAAMAGVDGASNAADEIEQLFERPRSSQSGSSERKCNLRDVLEQIRIEITHSLGVVAWIPSRSSRLAGIVQSFFRSEPCRTSTTPSSDTTSRR